MQPCRDGRGSAAAAAIIEPPDVRIIPPPLPIDVADVWAEYVDAAIAHGLKQCDADTFAEWCSMAAVLRRCRNTEVEDELGNKSTEAAPAPASYVAQFRMLGELLGLAGPGSRVVSKGAEAAKSNPFARNGRR